MNIISNIFLANEDKKAGYVFIWINHYQLLVVYAHSLVPLLTKIKLKFDLELPTNRKINRLLISTYHDCFQ